MNKKLTAAGLAAGLLAGTGAGLILELSGSANAASSVVAVAGTDDTGTESTDGTGDTGTDAARPDPAERLTEVLQPLVDDGTLTPAQLDAVISALEAAGPMGHGGAGGDQGGRGMGRGGANLDVVASTLGLTADEVRTAIQGGQTIADLAAANGSSAENVIDALVASMKAHLDEEVAAGEHTQDEADQILVDATARITEFVNTTASIAEAGPMNGGPGGRGHRPGDGDGTGTSTGTGTDTGVIDGGPADSATA